MLVYHFVVTITHIFALLHPHSSIIFADSKMSRALLPARVVILLAAMHSASACIYLLGTAPNSEVSLPEARS